MTRLFDLDFQLLADAGLMMIAVFALFLVASYFLFNPVRDMLQKRQDKIKGELSDAEKDKEQAAELKAQYEAKLKGIEKEAEEILSNARKKAMDNESRIINEAKEEALQIRERAMKEAELEKKKAADEVKREMVVLASLMAGKVVKESIDTTVQNQMIEDTLKEMSSQTWLS